MHARQGSIVAHMDDICSDVEVKLKIMCGIPLAEQELSDAIQNYCSLMAFYIAQGREVSYDNVNAAINQIAEEHGFLTGVPIPYAGDDSTDMVMARGVPLAEIFNINQEYRQLRTEMESQLTHAMRHDVINSWNVLGDKTVCVMRTTEGPMALPQYAAGLRLRKIFHGVDVRFHSHMRAEAELKAMESLKTRVSEGQYTSYVLGGIFPEQSKRSGVIYFFRKGLPTLAVSFHGQNKDTGKVLAALCLHPMGYYAGTHVGLMTPTDEVIAHLLMMRSDERRYWAKSGQWSAIDSRSGI
jgi:hypothetical protein